MEITRVYTPDHTVSPMIYRAVYPSSEQPPVDVHQDTEAFYRETDAWCISMEEGTRGLPGFAWYWGVRTREDQVFNIPRNEGEQHDDYEKLAKTLEQQIGRVGLTIIAL